VRGPRKLGLVPPRDPTFGRARNVGAPPPPPPPPKEAQGPGKWYRLPPPKTYKRPYDYKPTVDDTPYMLVASHPSGMNVFVDGRPAGKTPLLRRSPPDAKRVRVRLEGEGFEPIEDTFSPDKAGHIRVGVQMRKLETR
ncbi:MAG: PEGA domain-containing protein, partial [Myxococcota bacterium]